MLPEPLPMAQVAKQAMGEQIKKEIAVMKMVKQRHVVNLIEARPSRHLCLLTPTLCRSVRH